MLLFILVTCFTVALVVVIHYEILRALSQLLPMLHIIHRHRIAVGVLGALVAHAIEIWIFAAVYYWMIQEPAWGSFQGAFNGNFMDCVYFSFTSYTTLGFGDIEPHGMVRYLTGIESLTGLVLVTWSASFLFYEMQKYWEQD
ncbi:potassium channel family protein [Pseudoteredinibacter isoporae]|uniref:Potassium channel domain-containing protein n=1 Tax=Pseudoteredinibacter isoporae TaxID=570281 RepID=A0A7X0JW24_9GAMM|nr:potassium channel family protein [Pseudoteredinibacter isoporae]MBB6523314.1 hypothetical protein [Pseudoteredinibacter isoporae]